MSVLVSKSERHVIELLSDKLSNKYLYHNLTHTQRVVEGVEELIAEENFSEIDSENLLIAAWFHDLGYIERSEEHEAISANMATHFLKSEGLDDTRIEAISKLILATEMGYEPQSLQEKVIKDADNSHFGKKNYFEISDLLREEWNITGYKSFTDIEWTKENIAFFTLHHKFYTTFALKKWQKIKDKNLSTLYKNLKKQTQYFNKDKVKKEELNLKKNKAILPERGIETMFRVSLRNHITLSDIADTKANILLSVNAIIISLALSSLLPKLDNPSNTYLIYPTVIFVIFTIVSMVLSVLATRPNVTEGTFTKADVSAKKVNLLFFGNFHKMSLPDFEWAMNEMMQDKNYLYSSMTKDLYFLGKVLNRKYKILRITYTVFMIGIIVSVMAFAIAFQFQGNPIT